MKVSWFFLLRELSDLPRCADTILHAALPTSEVIIDGFYGLSISGIMCRQSARVVCRTQSQASLLFAPSIHEMSMAKTSIKQNQSKVVLHPT